MKYILCAITFLLFWAVVHGGKKYAYEQEPPRFGGAPHKEDTMTVKDRQCLLTFLKKADGTSYYTGEVDGIYGRLSRKAIQDFQKDFCGLTVTGEADAVTDQAMIHAVAFGIPERDPEAEPDAADNNVDGTVDADNNIILTGNLADGIYTLKYENAEGAQAEIGTVKIGTTNPSE